MTVLVQSGSFVKLSKCPDQFPSPETTELSFMEPDDFRKNLRLDMSAANRALANSEWKAATVLAGSVVEALLLWAIQRRSSDEVGQAVERLRQRDEPHTGKKIVGRKPDHDLTKWDLHEYVEVAAELRVITVETAAQIRLAKDFRNLIHPGRALRLARTCDRGTALSAVAAIEHVVRDLTHNGGGVSS